MRTHLEGSTLQMKLAVTHTQPDFTSLPRHVLLRPIQPDTRTLTSLVWFHLKLSNYTRQIDTEQNISLVAPYNGWSCTMLTVHANRVHVCCSHWWYMKRTALLTITSQWLSHRLAILIIFTCCRSHIYLTGGIHQDWNKQCTTKLVQFRVNEFNTE